MATQGNQREYEYAASDGTAYIITAPPGASEASMREFAISKFERPGYGNDPQHIPLTESERSRSEMIPRFLEGAASPFTALLELAGPQGAKDYINEYQRDREQGMLKQHKGLNVAGGLGQLSTGLIPAGLIGKGAQGASTAAKYLAKPLATHVGGGALQGALTPMDDEGESPYGQKALQVGMSAALGGAIGHGVVPVVKGVGGYLADKARFADTFTPGGGRRLANRSILDRVPEAERQGVIADLKQASADPLNEGQLSSQLLRGMGKQAPLVNEFEDVSRMIGGNSTAYRGQTERLLERPRTMLSSISGGGTTAIDADAKAASEAMSAAFTKAQQSANPINVKSVISDIDAAIRDASGTAFVLDKLGNPQVSSTGAAVMRSTGKPIDQDLVDELKGFRNLLFMKDTPEEFASKLRGTAADHPVISKNITVKGYGSKFNKIIDELKDDGEETVALKLKELSQKVKKSASTTQDKTVEDDLLELGRSIKAVRTQLKGGPTHLADNARTILTVRAEVDKAMKGAAGKDPHAAEVFGKMKDSVDSAVSRADKDFGVALDVRRTAGREHDRRRVADELLRSIKTETNEYTPANFLAALGNPDLARRAGAGRRFDSIKDALTKQEMQSLERDKAAALGVSRDTPNMIAAPDPSKIGPIPGATGRASLAVRELDRYGRTKATPAVQARFWELENNPDALIELLNKQPGKFSKITKAIMENEIAKNVGQAAAPRFMASQY